MLGRVLIVAGADSGGGAGIQADIKTVTALGGYAASAITALTAQDTLGVHKVVLVEAEFVQQQMRVVLDDIGADVIKTGMLPNTQVMEAVAGLIESDASNLPVVLDPVMQAKGGSVLMKEEAIQTLTRCLLPMAALVTPNVPEAERLTGMKIENLTGMRKAASVLLKMGPGAVLLKGAHLSTDRVVDVLLSAEGEERFEGPRIHTVHTHGTGCTLASAIATGLAQGLSLSHAVSRARAYLIEAIRTAPGLGSGHGPLNHGHTCQRGVREVT